MSSNDGPGDREARQDNARRLIVFAVGAAIGGVALAWLVYTIRDTLLTVYISALFAMGISPLVRMSKSGSGMPAV